MQLPNYTARILGGGESQVFVGIGPHTVLGFAQGIRAFAMTVRTQGTIIAWMIAQDEDNPASAYAPNFVTPIVLNQGDYLVFGRSVIQIQLTAAADSVTLWCAQNQ